MISAASNRAPMRTRAIAAARPTRTPMGAAPARLKQRGRVSEAPAAPSTRQQARDKDPREGKGDWARGRTCKVRMR